MAIATTYQITEYGSFVSGKEVPGCVTLPENTFDQLEAFLLANRNRDTDALELMGISARKGVGKIITAKNYIGLIAMNDGTTIEILPKIHSKVEGSVKSLVIDMLKALRSSPYKSLQSSHVDVEKMALFESFIRMFIDEAFRLVKHGLKSNYETVQANEGFVKGKLVFNEHIKRNYAHREKAFVEYDEFNNNRVENRLIKSTLLYLYRKTASTKNKTDLKTLLNAFSDVEPSVDYKGDFGKCVPDRNMKDYETVLVWCRIFLTGQGFTSFEGTEVAYALLFPMETLFESYIAAMMKKAFPEREFSVSAQDRKYHLFDYPGKRFLMRPDLVVTRKTDGAIFVMDTKWKLLSANKPHYGISQPDMYQMYAYQKKYGAENITLLYPLTDEVPAGEEIVFQSKDGVTVRVEFIDLFRTKDSLTKVLEELQVSERI